MVRWLTAWTHTEDSLVVRDMSVSLLKITPTVVGSYFWWPYRYEGATKWQEAKMVTCQH